MTKVEELQQVYRELEAAAPSLPLATGADDIVPGEGSPEARIMFIGEAPGYVESVQHRPFVGKSGQLFRKVLIEATGFDERDVYISNIVKVRPPDNRDPLPKEIEAYKPFLNREIEIIKPEIIATLGRFSMAKFLPNVKVSQVHGRLHKIKWHDRILYILPMYHPAAALRAPKVKLSFIEDLKKVPAILKWIAGQAEVSQLQQSVAEALF